jgi:ribonuclease D
MEIFLHLFDKLPEPLFDTQIAAMVLGHGDQVSYEKLVNHYTKGKLDKGSRFSDWLQRPLTERQVDYALSDVTYLRDIYEQQVNDLKERKRAKWVEEEMKHLLDVSTYNTDPETAWERIKLRSRKEKTVAVAKELAAWRERKAQTKDQPRGRIMHDNTLAGLAAQPPQSPDELAKMRGISNDLAHSPRGQQILDAIAEGLANKKAKKLIPPKVKPPTKRASAIAEILRLVLKIKCNEHDVVPRIVASNEDILALAGDDKAKVPARKGWRYEVFGQYALDIKHGRLVIGVDENGNANLIER